MAPNPLASIDNPEQESLQIRFPNVFVGGKPLSFKSFLSYEYHQHWRSQSDAWSFTLSQDTLSEIDIIAIVPRTRVEVSIDDVVQSIGILDEVRVRSDRNGGTIVTLEGRDWLSPAVDCHIDPNTRFKPSMTLVDVLDACFAPFGATVFADDNLANRNSITGATVGPKTSKKGKLLKSYLLHELKPYQQESAFNFASRVSQRFGLWIWAGQDGQTVIVGKPDYAQDARYQLRHLTSDPTQNNVIESDVTISAKDQPSCILSCGFGGGGTFANSTLRSGIRNPIIDADITAILNAYPSVKFVTVPAEIAALVPITDPGPRPLFLYDPDSHTQDQLDAYTLRELSLLLAKSLSAHYTIMGHKLGGQNVTVDTIVDVYDERSNLQTPLWVVGRSFAKRPSSGTSSTIECLRPGSMQF